MTVLSWPRKAVAMALKTKNGRGKTRRDFDMLNAIIDLSLRNRWLVLLAWAALVVLRRRVDAASRHRRLPGHDAGAGADQHRRPRARPRGNRGAAHVSRRTGPRRLARTGIDAFRVEVRPVAGRRQLHGRHRHLLRTPGHQRTIGERPASRRRRSAEDGARVDRPRRSLSLPPDRHERRHHRAAHAARLGRPRPKMRTR